MTAVSTGCSVVVVLGQRAKFYANPGPAVLSIFQYLKFTGPTGIASKYSMPNLITSWLCSICE